MSNKPWLEPASPEMDGLQDPEEWAYARHIADVASPLTAMVLSGQGSALGTRIEQDAEHHGFDEDILKREISHAVLHGLYAPQFAARLKLVSQNKAEDAYIADVVRYAAVLRACDDYFSAYILRTLSRDGPGDIKPEEALDSLGDALKEIGMGAVETKVKLNDLRSRTERVSAAYLGRGRG